MPKKPLRIAGATTAHVMFPDDMTACELARMFHENYERLAPEYGYKTREASAVEWENVPQKNKTLMIATAAAVLRQVRNA